MFFFFSFHGADLPPLLFDFYTNTFRECSNKNMKRKSFPSILFYLRGENLSNSVELLLLLGRITVFVGKLKFSLAKSFFLVFPLMRKSSSFGWMKNNACLRNFTPYFTTRNFRVPFLLLGLICESAEKFFQTNSRTNRTPCSDEGELGENSRNFLR